MRNLPDKLEIINPVDGTIIFSTGTPVKGTIGSGQTVNYNLGDGNLQILILVNGGVTTNKNTAYTFQIVSNPQNTSGPDKIVDTKVK